ncbi:MAG: hypothetical protein O3A14_00685 [Cyanobacteria bacterium]|nr:hypothetical protein [Cyanobacteriota bacterium]
MKTVVSILTATPEKLHDPCMGRLVAILSVFFNIDFHLEFLGKFFQGAWRIFRRHAKPYLFDEDKVSAAYESS